MKCPIDGAQLVMSERQGVEIDYCPTCRGVWLDRGELDKIVELSLQHAQPVRSMPQPDQRGGRDWDGDDDDFRGRDPRRSKRKSLLGELFDF